MARGGTSMRETSPPALIYVQSICGQNQNEMKLHMYKDWRVVEEIYTWQWFWDVIYHHHRALWACETLKGDAALGNRSSGDPKARGVSNEANTSGGGGVIKWDKRSWTTYVYEGDDVASECDINLCVTLTSALTLVQTIPICGNQYVAINMWQSICGN